MLRQSGLQDFYRESENLTIVDAYAGYGWFSTALYNTLRPKKLILMDPFMYAKPALQKMVEHDPKRVTHSTLDPYHWRSFYPIYEDVPKRYNNADRSEVSRDFLFVANLAYSGGESLMYQYLLCVLHQNWLQRYGRVRMLVWMCSSGAEKLTHGQRRMNGKSQEDILSDVEEREMKLMKFIVKREKWIRDPKVDEKKKPGYKQKIEMYLKELAELRERKNSAVSLMSNKRYKSTIVREMTCDYRYLIGGEAVMPRKGKTWRSSQDVAKSRATLEFAEGRVARRKEEPTSHPRDKDSLVYFEKGYPELFTPNKTSTIGGLVLLELTPKDFKIENYEEWFYVVTKLFITTGMPLSQSLEALGPGAIDWMAPHLPASILRKRITDVTIDELNQIVDVFWKWPFKPTVLQDSYMEKVQSIPDEKMFANAMFDVEDMDMEGLDGEEVDDMEDE